MSQKTFATIALAITAAYGLLFIVVGEDMRNAYAIIGGLVVAALWVSVGMFGRKDPERDSLSG